eukprot:XP_014774691.1 PREDICTED: keratin, type II cytoskeletal 2 epidermal-like [Octopus bimaculoides]
MAGEGASRYVTTWRFEKDLATASLNAGIRRGGYTGQISMGAIKNDIGVKVAVGGCGSCTGSRGAGGSVVVGCSDGGCSGCRGDGNRGGCDSGGNVGAVDDVSSGGGGGGGGGGDGGRGDGGGGYDNEVVCDSGDSGYNGAVT